MFVWVQIMSLGAMGNLEQQVCNYGWWLTWVRFLLNPWLRVSLLSKKSTKNYCNVAVTKIWLYQNMISKQLVSAVNSFDTEVPSFRIKSMLDHNKWGEKLLSLHKIFRKTKTKMLSTLGLAVFTTVIYFLKITILTSASNLWASTLW